MRDLLFSGAICLIPPFIAFFVVVIFIVSIETLTGTMLGQWPEKIHTFFKKRGWVADKNHQI